MKNACIGVAYAIGIMSTVYVLGQIVGWAIVHVGVCVK
ncbi:hypothetical protein BX604_7320 [Burkholderia sp. JKS000303]|nr:hypothetical protein BX604_7320 [Burkholderia sp. JKS000303]